MAQVETPPIFLWKTDYWTADSATQIAAQTHRQDPKISWLQLKFKLMVVSVTLHKNNQALFTFIRCWLYLTSWLFF